MFGSLEGYYQVFRRRSREGASLKHFMLAIETRPSALYFLLWLHDWRRIQARGSQARGARQLTIIFSHAKKVLVVMAKRIVGPN